MVGLRDIERAFEETALAERDEHCDEATADPPREGPVPAEQGQLRATCRDDCREEAQETGIVVFSRTPFLDHAEPLITKQRSRSEQLAGDCGASILSFLKRRARHSRPQPATAEHP